MQEQTLLDTIIFLASGLVVMYVATKFKQMTGLLNYPYINSLFECGLCLGVWNYFILSFIFKYSLFTIPIVGEFVTACLSSFVMWVFVAGWNSMFREIRIVSE